MKNKDNVNRNEALLIALIMMGYGAYLGYSYGKSRGRSEAYAETRSSEQDARMARRVQVIEQKLDIQPETPYAPYPQHPIPVRVVMEGE